MIKKFFLIFFIFLSFLSNFSYSQTTTSNNITYDYVSPFDGGSGSKTIDNTSTKDVGYVFNYLLTGMAVVIVILVIYRLLQGAVIKGTIENFYSQMKGRKYIQTAGVALIIFIFAYAVLSFINPDLTGWTVATSYIGKVRDNISNNGSSSAVSNKCAVDPGYNAKSIEDEIKYDEQRGQFSSSVYLDQVGKPTIGWGFNLKQSGSANIIVQAGLSSDKATALANCSGPNQGCPTITKDEADAIFNISLNSAKANAMSFAGGSSAFNSLPPNVQKVLINMSYNMGSFASFPSSGDTSQGLQNKDWSKMAYGIQDSVYCSQVQDRCGRIVGLLLGTCPEPATTGSLASNSSLDGIKNDNGNTACPSGTTDIGTVKTNYTGQPVIRLCRLSSITGAGEDNKGNKNSLGAVVNAVVAAKFETLGENAKNAGIQLSANSSFRLENSCGGTGDGSYCASSGSSPHQLGIAIDFSNTGNVKGNTTSCSGRATGGTQTWTWLKNNAPSIGIKQYSGESWHWDLMLMANRCS